MVAQSSPWRYSVWCSLLCHSSGLRNSLFLTPNATSFSDLYYFPTPYSAIRTSRSCCSWSSYCSSLWPIYWMTSLDIWARRVFLLPQGKSWTASCLSSLVSWNIAQMLFTCSVSSLHNFSAICPRKNRFLRLLFSGWVALSDGVSFIEIRAFWWW